MTSPFLLLSLLGLDVSGILKIMIVGVFTLMTTASYMLMNAISKLIHTSQNKVISSPFISILGAYIFAYNPVNIQFVGGISILVGLAVLPLLLYFVVTRMSKWYFPLVAAGCLLFSLGHPFVFFMNAAVALIFTILIHRKVIVTRLIVSKLLMTCIVFVLLSAWLWLPYSVSPIRSVDLGRSDNIERGTFEVVSDNDFYKILLLERDRFIYTVTDVPDAPTANFFHYFALILIVGGAFISLWYIRNGTLSKIVVFLSIGFLFMMCLALGSNGILDQPYWLFISQSSIGWIFRSPLKFQLYQGLLIAILFVISAHVMNQVLRSRQKMRPKLASPLLAAVMVLIFVGTSAPGIYNANTSSFNPIEMPSEYHEINEILEQRHDGYKSLYYPRYNEIATTWSQGHIIGPYDTKSSGVPTYDMATSYEYIKTNLFDYPYRSDKLKTDAFYDYLSSIGVKYLIFHNDRGYALDLKNLNYLLSSESLNLLYAKNGWYLFEIETSTSPLIRTLDNLATVDSRDGLLSISSNQLGIVADLEGSSSAPSLGNLVKLTITNSSLETSLHDMVKNPSFELWDGPEPQNWNKLNVNFQLDGQSDGENGTRYLEITSPLSSTHKEWSQLTSDPVAVRPADKYLFSILVKTLNVDGSHVKIQGYNTTSSKWVDLSFLTRDVQNTAILSINGDTAWKSYSKVVVIPKSINGTRFVINAGATLDGNKGNALTLVANTGMYDLKTFPKSLETVEYTKVSSTAYDVHINSQQPFVLVMSESFDKGWVARYEGQDIPAFRLYDTINGFYIDHPGDIDLRIEYRPQTFVVIGEVVSLIAVAGILSYVFAIKFWPNKVQSSSFGGTVVSIKAKLSELPYLSYVANPKRMTSQPITPQNQSSAPLSSVKHGLNILEFSGLSESQVGGESVWKRTSLLLHETSIGIGLILFLGIPISLLAGGVSTNLLATTAVFSILISVINSVINWILREA